MSTRGDCSDTQSDCTGRSSSLASRDDLQEVAASLGIANVDMLFSDKFKVDRKRIEDLLFANENAAETAVEFFNNIMYDTNTKILWPNRLKMGAKSKKDPVIKVMGLIEDVARARKKLQATLDTRSSKVTMKVDISYTDHSHIIGKSGSSIKTVMEETKCHIHFPDSNRNSMTEKSNQVSITGSVQGVELARSRVRELTPVIFCFDFPIVGTMLDSGPDPSEPFIQNLQKVYNVQVMFRSSQKLNSTMILVKGCEWEVEKVMEATQLLISHTCDQWSNQVQVYTMMEISPQHQRIVIGQYNENLRGIMQRTSTQIVFIDPHDPNIPNLKKSNVTISGSIKNIYLARQQLIGSLPVVMIFDVPDYSIVVDYKHLEEIMSNLDVFISTKNKVKQNLISFIIKGFERNVANIYEARRQILWNDEAVEVNVPSTYFNPNPGSTFRANYCQVPIEVSSPVYVVNGNGPGTINNNLFQFPLGMAGAGAVAGGGGGAPAATPHHLFPPHQFFHRPQSAVQLPHQLHPHLAQHLGQFSHTSVSLPNIPIYSSVGRTSNYSSPSTSPRTSPIPQYHSEKSEVPSGSDSQLSTPSEWKAPNSERNTIDYQQLKLQAINVSQKAPNPSELRVPNSVWSGLGFSQSSPYSAFKEAKKEDDVIQNDNRDNSNQRDACQDESGANGVSNYFELVSPSTLPMLNTDNLGTLLASVGLEKYIPLFVKHEVDLNTFRTLRDSDLKEIGVSAFGARRKIAFCIAELNRQARKISFSGSVAPGAERESRKFQNC